MNGWGVTQFNRLLCLPLPVLGALGMAHPWYRLLEILGPHAQRRPEQQRGKQQPAFWPPPRPEPPHWQPRPNS